LCVCRICQPSLMTSRRIPAENSTSSIHDQSS
jgi:hypothetical protein